MRLLSEHSDRQHIELYKRPGSGLTLVMDGMVQFTESVEYRYHEALAVVPMLYTPAPRIFIGGGGDGLAATRLLRFPEVERLVVCDYDPLITKLAVDQRELSVLNQGSFHDRRVQVINDDAYVYLERSEEQFDLIICDFPDPLYAGLNRLYSIEFYELVKERLRPGGVMVTQTRNVPVCISTVGATLSEVFGNYRYYRFAQHGFSLASDAPLQRRRGVPAWARFIDDQSVEGLFTLARDERDACDIAAAEPNLADSETLYKLAVFDAYIHLLAVPCDYSLEQLLCLELLADTAELLGDRWTALLDSVLDETELLVWVGDGVATTHREVLRARGFSVRQTLVQLTLTIDSRVNAPAQVDGAAYEAQVSELCAPRDVDHLQAILGLDSTASRVYLPKAWRQLADAVEHPLTLSLEQPTMFIALGKSGKASALFRVGAARDGVALALIWEHGDCPARVEDWLTAVEQLRSMRVESLTLLEPSSELAAGLGAIGVSRWQEFDVYARTST